MSHDPRCSDEVRALLPQGYTARRVEGDALSSALKRGEVALLILDLTPGNANVELWPGLNGVPLAVLVPSPVPTATVHALLDLSLVAAIPYPADPEIVRPLLVQALERAQARRHQQRIQRDLNLANRRLNQRLQELNTIYTVGRFVASTLNLDEVLSRVVEASVNLTQGEEGFILLREGEHLYLRIVKSLAERAMHRLRQQVGDDIAWQVIHSGRPTMLRRELQIATGRTARALLYVPMSAPGHGVIGVLGVVRLREARPFTEHHLFTLSSLADYAAIAVENARLFSTVEAQRSRLSSILEYATEIILVTDSEDRLMLWSRAAAEIFHIRDTMRGQTVYRAIDHTEVHELFRAADEDERARTIHREIKMEDGRVFNAQLSPIRDVGQLVVMQDITHLKELDRLKSEFVFTVSHDLRTPLTTVRGYIELLERVGPLNQMQRDFIGKALRSLNHITTLISDLLDIGRIEAGYDLEMEPCRLDDIIRQVADEYAIHAERHEITLTYDLPQEPLLVLGSRNRLRQAVQNLVNNAIKYNRPGGWVKIAGRQDDKHVIVEVHDSGIGIPVEEQPKIFERFYRVQTPETEHILGTGLGLAIVKSVIEKHKGRIWVRSRPGEGSTFTFIIPRHLDVGRKAEHGSS